MSGEVKENDGRVVLPLRNVGLRKCILTRATHDSNNAYLLVRGEFVYYKCHSQACRNKRHCLGKLPQSWSTYRSSAAGNRVPVKRHRTADATEALSLIHI